ncbi:unnamed protein product, partial [Schistosoma turkestanicum]
TSILIDELQRETEEDKCTLEKAKTKCQTILDEIEECQVSEILPTLESFILLFFKNKQ